MLIRALGKCFEIRKAPGQLVRQVRFLPVEKEISPWAASRDVMDTVLSGFFASNTSASAAAKLLQSCPTLCDPIDGSPPGSPIPGILQARTLEWVAIAFSNAGK